MTDGIAATAGRGLGRSPDEARTNADAASLTCVRPREGDCKSPPGRKDGPNPPPNGAAATSSLVAAPARAVDPVAEARRVFSDMLADASDETLERPGWRDDAEGRAPDKADDAAWWRCHFDLGSGHRRAVCADGTVYCATCHPHSTSDPARPKSQEEDGLGGKVQRPLDIEEDFPRSAWDAEPPAECSAAPIGPPNMPIPRPNGPDAVQIVPAPALPDPDDDWRPDPGRIDAVARRVRPKNLWRHLPKRCWTCGAPPIGRYPDKSPLYRCPTGPHSPVTGDPEGARAQGRETERIGHHSASRPRRAPTSLGAA